MGYDRVIYNFGGTGMLESKDLKLREVEESDLEIICKWRNNWDVLKNLFSYLPISLTKQKRWYENYINDSTTQTFIIEYKIENKPIGTVTLAHIDYKNQNAEAGILIGEKDYRGKGLAKQALNLVIDYGFNELNLNRIYLHLLETNQSALRLYESLGFKREGLLRNHQYKQGRFCNVIVMGLLKDEYLSNEVKDENNG